MKSRASSRAAPRRLRRRLPALLGVALIALLVLPAAAWAQANLTLAGDSPIACNDSSPPNQCFYDSNGKPGETIHETASGTIPGYALPIDHYEWFDGSGYPNTPLASTSGPTYDYAAADGSGTLYVVLCSIPIPAGGTTCLGSSAPSGIASVDYTVVPPNLAKVAAPTAGQVFPDTDQKPGENVTLDATGSTQGDCGIAEVPTCSAPTYQWTVNGTVTSSATVKTTVHLPDGNSTISLVVLDKAQTSLATAQITVTVKAPPYPTAAIAGGNRTVPDSDGKPGENVPMDGSGSTAVAPATIASYAWSVNGTVVAGATGAKPTLALPDGANAVSLVVTDSNGLKSPAVSVTITVVAPAAPTAVIAGGNRTIPDSDGKPGENVPMDGSGSSAVAPATLASYAWSVNGSVVAGATGAQPTLALADGVSTVSLVVTDSHGLKSPAASVTITVVAPAAPSAVIAGGNRTVPDTNGKPGETVVMDGSGSTAVSPKTLVSYIWSVNGAVTGASGPKPSLALPDGASTVSLVVVDSLKVQSAPASVLITVLAPSSAISIQIAGGNRLVSDTDGLPGARVPFSASATFSDGPVPASAFKWTATAAVNGQNVTVDSAAGTATPTLRLHDGANTVTASVTIAGATGTASVIVTVSGSIPAASAKPLSSIPGLTPNQTHVAQAVEQACGDLTSQFYARPGMSSDAIDLLQQCRALIKDHIGGVNVTGLRAALDAMSGQPVTEMQRLGLDYADTQFKNLGNRLIELRSGQHGASTAGLTLQGGDVSLPLEQLVQVFREMLGGGAGDPAPESELSKDRLGFFVTGNLRVGDRASTQNEAAFSARNDSLTVGADYRVTDFLVLGASVGYGHTDSSFSAPDARIDSKNRTFSLYGSVYQGNWYLDFIASLGKLDYDSARHVEFMSSVITAPAGVVDRLAEGSTSGRQSALSASTGYDWHWGGVTAGPLLTLNYTKLRVDSFEESGASGLNLSYDDQNGESFNAQAGAHLAYVINTPLGVLMPHVKAAAVHEFASGAQSVNAHFSADAAAQFELLTDAPDRNYFNWSAGVSAQFPFGIAAFADYQSIAGLSHTSLHDTSVGVRVATHW